MNNKESSIETCELIEKIKEILDSHGIEIYSNYKLDDKYYILADEFVTIVYEGNGIVSLSFHVATRADTAAKFILELHKFSDVEVIDVLDLYIEDENGNIITGEKCIEKYKRYISEEIISSFTSDQINTHLLYNSYAGKIC